MRPAMAAGTRSYRLAKSKLSRLGVLLASLAFAGCVEPSVPARQAVQHSREQTEEIDELRKKQMQEVEDEGKKPAAGDADSAEEP